MVHSHRPDSSPSSVTHGAEKTSGEVTPTVLCSEDTTGVELHYIN